MLQATDGIILPSIAKECLPVFHLFVIQIDNRDAVAEALQLKGIHTGLHYPVPLHMQQAYSYLKLHKGKFPVAEHHAKKLLSLPMFPELTREQISYVCSCLKETLTKKRQ
jgi:dTDP-4-amino-4,6-dideoxygalactose transaminase